MDKKAFTPLDRKSYLTGFTLLELLVVIAILGIILTMLFPALGKVREGGRRVQCTNNLRQHGIAWYLYLDDHEERFPKSGQPPSPTQCNSQTFGGKVGDGDPFDNYTADMRPLNRYLDVTDTSADIFHCPTDTRPGFWPETWFDETGTSYTFNLNILEFGSPQTHRPLSTITSPHNKVYLETCTYYKTPGHDGHGSDNIPNTPVMVLFVDGHVKMHLYGGEVDFTGTDPSKPVWVKPD